MAPVSKQSSSLACPFSPRKSSIAVPSAACNSLRGQQNFARRVTDKASALGFNDKSTLPCAKAAVVNTDEVTALRVFLIGWESEFQTLDPQLAFGREEG